MQFLYPGFLWALTALAIPIILHLFYFRRYKKIYFSNLRFLREVKEETSARNRLRNLLILFSRLLAFAFLIFAFAQPILPVKQALQSGIRNVCLFVDNSFSMQSFGDELSLFDQARQKAKQVIEGYSSADKFQLIGHELSASQNQWVSQEEALQRLEDWQYTPSVKTLSVVQDRQKQALASEEGIDEAWMISDFQKSITDIDPEDTTYQLNLLPLYGVQEKNVAIDTAWFDSPVLTLNQTGALVFRIKNYSADDIDNIRLSVDIDGQERPEGSFDIEANSTLLDTIQITILSAGWHQVAVRISDFPVTFDDSYYLSYYVDEKLNVLSIYDKSDNPKYAALFGNNQAFTYQSSSVGQINYAGLNRFNLVLLHELPNLSSGLTSSLKQYIENGGKVLFIPSANASVENYNQFLRTFQASSFGNWSEGVREVNKVNTDAFLYKDVFKNTKPNMRLPKVNASYARAATGTQGQSLLAFRDGGDLATFYPIQKGALVVFSAPVDETINDISIQPEIFVPLLYKLAIYRNDARRISYTIGKDYLIPLEIPDYSPSANVSMEGPENFIPGISQMGKQVLIDVQGQVDQAGFYQLKNDVNLWASIAFNYDRNESDLALTPIEELPSNGKITIWDETAETDLSAMIKDVRQGKPLWKYCIILALVFLFIEIALIRLWKFTW